MAFEMDTGPDAIPSFRLGPWHSHLSNHSVASPPTPSPAATVRTLEGRARPRFQETGSMDGMTLRTEILRAVQHGGHAKEDVAGPQHGDVIGRHAKRETLPNNCDRTALLRGGRARPVKAIPDLSGVFDSAPIAFEFHWGDVVAGHAHFLEPGRQRFLARRLRDAKDFTLRQMARATFECNTECKRNLRIP